MIVALKNEITLYQAAPQNGFQEHRSPGPTVFCHIQGMVFSDDLKDPTGKLFSLHPSLQKNVSLTSSSV
jgi:hypothetical protein